MRNNCWRNLKECFLRVERNKPCRAQNVKFKRKETKKGLRKMNQYPKLSKTKNVVLEDLVHWCVKKRLSSGWRNPFSPKETYWKDNISIKLSGVERSILNTPSFIWNNIKHYRWHIGRIISEHWILNKFLKYKNIKRG